MMKVTQSEDLKTALTLKGWKFTRHALLRMEEMDLSKEQVCEVLNDPHLVYQTTKYPGTMTACKGSLAVPYSPTESSIITVLWHGQDHERPAI